MRRWLKRRIVQIIDVAVGVLYIQVRQTVGPWFVLGVRVVVQSKHSSFGRNNAA